MSNIHFKEFVELLNTIEPSLKKDSNEIAKAIESKELDNFFIVSAVV